MKPELVIIIVLVFVISGLLAYFTVNECPDCECPDIVFTEDVVNPDCVQETIKTVEQVNHLKKVLSENVTGD